MAVPETASRAPRSLRTALLYLTRAMRLRCPLCGISPLFGPAREIRSLASWLDPLPGCPGCGYRYERENGYFLMAIWAVQYGAAAVFGLATYAVLATCFTLTLGEMLFWTMAPLAVFCLAFIRFAKAIWLAFDLWISPPAAKAG